MPVNGRHKGKRAMKFVCEYLKKIYPDLSFERNLKNRSGDIFTTTDFPFVVEVKNQECWKFCHFFGPENRIYSHMAKFWQQVNRDVKLLEKQSGVRKIPWLVFTKNREPYYFMFSRDDMGADSYILLLKLSCPTLYIPRNRLVVFPALPAEKMRRFLASLTW